MESAAPTERLYRRALLLILGLVLANQLLVQPSLVDVMTDAPRINVAGRQRMLGQRLAKAALLLERGAPAARQEIGRVLGPWSEAHERLRRNAAGAVWFGPDPGAVRAGLDAIEPDYQALHAAARRIAERATPSGEDPTDVATILAHESAYLEGMDRVVGQIEQAAQARVARVRGLGWLLTGLTLLGLAAVGRWIVRPAARLIERQFEELRRGRDELEERVRERTLDLEQAQERHRRLLDQFGQVQRRSAVGELASTLAHELNQPLGAIANYAGGCRIALARTEPDLGAVREALDRLQATALRAGRILDQVRRFVRGEGPRLEPFDPNAAVQDALAILGGAVRDAAVTLRLELAPGLPWLVGDPVQIQQVVVNLTQNALQSLTSSQTEIPKLVIATRLRESDEVEFTVSDNGPGIEVERLPKVFDAHFSTRATGMGMGLAICRTLVEAHHGRIWAESEPGVRTTVGFRLPVLGPDAGRPDGACGGR